MNKQKIITKLNLYVIPLGNAWGVKGEGSTKFTFITDTKKEALIYAKGLAVSRSADLIVYGRDGKIATRNSYAKKEGGSLAKK